MADPRYPVIRWTGGTPRFNLLMTIAQTEATAHALGDPRALPRFERAFDLMRRLGVFGVPSHARVDLLRSGQYRALRYGARPRVRLLPEPPSFEPVSPLEASWTA